MAKFKEKLKAREFRRKGVSIIEIAKKLGVSKGSVSLWCQDIRLTDEQKNKLQAGSIKGGYKGRMIGAEMNRRKKIEAIEYYKLLAKKQLNRISDRDLLVAGVALYWGEGSKSDKSQLAFVNSDPEAIKFMFCWFKKIMHIKNEEFMPRIFINNIHKNRIKKVLKFWSKLLNLPEGQFGNPVFLGGRPKKVYENHDNYYGVLSLKIRKSSKIKYHVLGFIEALKKSY